MYLVTGYYNTGFDIINVPDSPSLLRSCSTARTFPAFDILNKRFLSTIRIKINPANGENDLAGLEYLELYEEGKQSESVFYYVSSYQLTSRDVAILSVCQDSFLTIGGINAFENASLFAKRTHISRSDDDFGKWTEDDELLCPNEPLQLVHSGNAYAYEGSGTPLDPTNTGVECDANQGMFFNFSKTLITPQSGSFDHVIITSVAVTKEDPNCKYLTKDYLNDELEFAGDNFLYNGSAVENMHNRYPVIPAATGIVIRMPHVIYGPTSLVPAAGNLISFNMPVDFNTNNNVYEGGESDLCEAMAVLRDVGMESGVLFSYRLRKAEVNLVRTNSGKVERVDGRTYFAQGTGETDSTSAYRFDSGKSAAHVKNNRVLYGKFRSYVLSSPATGSTITAKPEELYPMHFSGGLSGSRTAPYIVCFTDPRPSGRPYYNFFKLGQVGENAFEGNRYINISLGAIAGGQWPEVPIVFTGMSGAFQARVGYNINASYNDWLASPDNSYLSMMSGQSFNADFAFDKAQRMRDSGQAYTGLAAVPFIGKGVQRGQAMAAQYGTPYMVDEGVGETPSSYDANAGFNTGVGALAGGLIQAAIGWATANTANDVAKMTAEDNAENTYWANMAAAEHDAYGFDNSSFADIQRAAMEGSKSANASLQRLISKYYEYEKFNVSTTYAAPTAQFMATETMRDVNNNAVFYARYTPSTADMERMDKILDAFGYRVNMKVDWNYLKNRHNFNYFQGSVDMFGWKQSDLIKAMPGARDIMLDVNNQFANGIRIWHVAPTAELDPGN